MRSWIVLVLLAVLTGSALGQVPEPPHRHGYVPRPEDLTLPPEAPIPPPPSRPADVPYRPLTVREAVDIALLHQPAIGVARGNLQAASGRTRQTQAALNPNLSLTGTDTPISTALTGSGGGSGEEAGFNSASLVSSTGIQVTASVRQLLYDFAKTRHTVEQVRAQQAAALQNLAQANNDTVLQVEQAFYSCLQTQRLIQVNDTDVQNQRQHLEQAESLYRSGIGKPADVVRAENAVASALINLQQAEGDSDNARVNLAHVMGLDPRTPLSVDPGDLPEPAGTDLQVLIPQALQARPEVRAAEALVLADEHELQAARVNNAPSLSATASVITLPNPLESSQQLALLTAGLSLQWGFGDGGLTAGRVEEASGNLEAARYQLAAAQTQVVTDVTQSFVNLNTAVEKLRLSQVAVATAEENLKLARGRYSAGLGLAIDVLDAESALLTSLTSQVNQQAAVDQARASLWHALGGVQR